MKKDAKWKRIEVGCMIVVVILLTFVAGKYFLPEQESQKNVSTAFYNGWYQIQDGEKVFLTLPCSVSPDSNGKVVIYNDALADADKGKYISTRGVQYQLEARMGDAILYQYKDNKFQKNTQMKGKIWADFLLPDTIEIKPLCLVYKTENNKPIYIYAPIKGDYLSVIGCHIKESIFSILVIFGMLGLGAGSVFVFFYARHRRITEKRFFDVSIFLFLCAFWCISDSGLYQIYGKHSGAGTVVSFYAFMLMSVPVLHFVKNTVSEELQWIPRVWIFLLYANAILQGIVNVFLAVPFVHMLYITHLILFTGVIAMITILCKDYKKSRQPQVGLCLKAFGVLGIGGVAALALYWILSIYWYDVVFQFGILAFVLILFWGLLCKVANDIQFRVEKTVYERMSLEDRMTGMKNRKAFDRYLEDIQKSAMSLENAWLLFIDIAGLKGINDSYGLHVGDEAVIKTARAIEMAKRTLLEQSAECFRIEGDEFAVVVKNPKKSPKEWEKHIIGETQKENGNKYYIRLRMGYSYLKKSDGIVSTISDWKMQADQMLHLQTDRTAEDRYGI